MNIGLFTDTYYPEVNGVANSVYTLKTELENRGHNVYVITTTTPDAPEHEYNVFRVHSIPFVFMKDRRVGMFYQPKMAVMIRKLNLDIIHTHTEFSLKLFANIIAKDMKIPVVHTYHTIYEDYTHYFAPISALDNQAKRWARGYTRKCCNAVEEVIVPTKKVEELLMRYRVSKNINVIPTGINLTKFQKNNFTSVEIDELKESLGIAKTDKVILYLGRVSPEKNIEEILRAIPEYKGRHDDFRFVIVGAGPDLENLQAIAKELEVEDKVLFAGEQPWDGIAKFYQLGDVFVSASNSETQGLTYFEAMAAGLPVVAKEDECLEEILIDGHNGYKFNTMDELLCGLDQVLYSNDGVSYGENSEQMMRAYSTEIFAENVENVYKKVLVENELLVEAE